MLIINKNKTSKRITLIFFAFKLTILLFMNFCFQKDQFLVIHKDSIFLDLKLK